MPTMIENAVNEVANILGARRAVDVSDLITAYDDNSVALTKLLNQLPGKQKPLKNVQFSWWEDENNPREATLSGTVATAGVTLTVGSGESAYFRVGDIVTVPKVSGEEMDITAINGTNETLTVTRSIGAIAATTIPTASGVFLNSGHRSETSGTRPLLTTKVEQVTNYGQVFEQTFGTSIITNAMNIYGNKTDEHARLEAKHIIEMQLDKEYAFLTQQPAEFTTGGHYDWVTGGLRHWAYLIDAANSYANTNTLTSGTSAITEGDFDDFLADAYRYGTGKKLLIAGTRLVNEIHDFVKAKTQTFSGETRYGIGLRYYDTVYGDGLRILYHPLLRGNLDWLNFFIDVGYLKYRYLPGFRDTMFKDVHTPGDKKKIDTIVSICGMELKMVKAHGLVYYTAAAA